MILCRTRFCSARKHHSKTKNFIRRPISDQTLAGKLWGNGSALLRREAEEEEQRKTIRRRRRSTSVQRHPAHEESSSEWVTDHENPRWVGDEEDDLLMDDEDGIPKINVAKKRVRVRRPAAPAPRQPRPQGQAVRWTASTILEQMFPRGRSTGTTTRTTTTGTGGAVAVSGVDARTPVAVPEQVPFSSPVAGRARRAPSLSLSFEEDLNPSIALQEPTLAAGPRVRSSSSALRKTIDDADKFQEDGDTVLTPAELDLEPPGPGAGVGGERSTLMLLQLMMPHQPWWGIISWRSIIGWTGRRWVQVERVRRGCIITSVGEGAPAAGEGAPAAGEGASSAGDGASSAGEGETQIISWRGRGCQTIIFSVPLGGRADTLVRNTSVVPRVEKGPRKKLSCTRRTEK